MHGDFHPGNILAVAGPAWAHISLRMVDWAIRHFPAGQVDSWVELAQQRIDLVG